MQSIVVGVRADYPAIAALHPVNGFLMLLFAVLIARDAWIHRARSSELWAADRR